MYTFECPLTPEAIVTVGVPTTPLKCHDQEMVYHHLVSLDEICT